jgi:peptide/nickel transport system permease protein
MVASEFPYSVLISTTVTGQRFSQNGLHSTIPKVRPKAVVGLDCVRPRPGRFQRMMSPMASTTWTAVTALARRNRLAGAGLMMVLVLVFFAVFAPWIAPQSPSAIDLPLRLQPPSTSHWLGTDELGRDILSRAIYGARISMLVGASVVAGSLLIGLVLGSIAGYYGGRIDRFFNVVLMNAFLSFPGILLAIAFVAFLGPGIFNLILALCIGGWVGYARLVRAQVLAVKEKEFVEAARALGANDWRIVTRHILPNIIQPVIVQAAIGMAAAVLAEATMSFLGLGVPPPTASWGSMLSDGRAYLFDAPHLVLFPAAAVMLAVLSFNFIGDALRDYRTTSFTPATSVRRRSFPRFSSWRRSRPSAATSIRKFGHKSFPKSRFSSRAASIYTLFMTSTHSISIPGQQDLRQSSADILISPARN